MCFSILLGCSPSAWSDPAPGQSAPGFELRIDADQTDVTRLLSFNNPFSKRVEIKTVSVSCGCLKASVEPQTLAPGDSAQLSLHADTHNIVDSFTGYVVLETDSPDLLIKLPVSIIRESLVRLSSPNLFWNREGPMMCHSIVASPVRNSGVTGLKIARCPVGFECTALATGSDWKIFVAPSKSAEAQSASLLVEVLKEGSRSRFIPIKLYIE